MASRKVTSTIATIANDLLNLETNTILKTNITGRKMPKLRHALIDIGKKYRIKLRVYRIAIDDIDSSRLGGYTAFQTIYDKANQAIQRRKPVSGTLSPERDAELFMLYRIRDSSSQIKAMMEAWEAEKKADAKNELTRAHIAHAKPLDISPEHRVMIRKYWEIGVEEIAMQTVVQLDGDVVTRVQPKHALGQQNSLHAIHHEGVRVSIAYWKELIMIAKDFLGSLFSLLRPG